MSDVIVVGGGPSGLAAAINAAAEGMETTLVEGQPRLGGRVEPSHAIENYLGFLSISGRELADIARQQLEKFGVRQLKGYEVQKMSLGFFDSEWNRLQLKHGTTLSARNIIISTGMNHRDAAIPGAELFGVFYHAEPIEVEKWAGQSVLIVGGENSATQAALNFADHGAQVTMLIPKAVMQMSAYLQPIVNAHPNIHLLEGTLKSIDGHNGSCRAVELGTGVWIPTNAVVLFNGAYPRSEWCGSLIDKDPRGFITTDPYTYQCLHNGMPVPGVYAVGDVRAGSVKRVGAAVGEGTAVVRHIMVATQQQREQKVA